MKRSAWTNLGIPVVLLGKRMWQILSGAPSHFPFVLAEESNPAIEVRANALLSSREYGEQAVVVANLLRAGEPANVAADAHYTDQMLDLMAEGVHGPMHVADAVAIQGGEFDRVALVYYPGVQYFADMMRSGFYRSIVGDKQLGDTQASITVPVLDRI